MESCRINSPKSFGFFRKEFRQLSKKKGVISALSTALTRELSSLTLED